MSPLDAATEDLETYRGLLAAAGVDPSRLVPDATGTLCAPVEARLPQPVEELPVLVGGAHDQLRLRASIARGGMGQIHLADQVPLEREVAVKRAVRGSRDRHEASSSLLAEARVTGLLEHPHVVPVHALGRTADGDVLLVMKRIEGTAWSELLARRPDCGHDLEHHLEILADVCRAAHFAHARGVLHRDLKPQNVMLGAFGEVYVLDWGIAVCTGATRVAGAPHLDDVTGIAGTPAYMAPEMTLPGEPLDARTDVYLLGSVLHEILVGRPPHRRDSIAETLHAAYLSERPRFPPEVPVELAAVCARALARDPARRFASAEELRSALVEVRRHASARALAVAASERLARLRHLVEEGGEAPRPEQDLDVARAFSACRFGFDEALRAWPGSPEAAAGLREALVQMAWWEVRRGHADAARVLAQELQPAPGDLVQALALLEARLALDRDERRRLDEQARAADARPGSRGRLVVFLGVTTTWCAFAALTSVLVRSGRMTIGHLDLAAMNALCAVLFGIGWLEGRRQSEGAKVTRSYMSTAFAVQSAIVLLWLVLWRVDAPIWSGLAVAHAVICAAMFGVSRGFEAKLAHALWPVLVGIPLILLWPARALELNAACVAATLALLSVHEAKEGFGARGGRPGPRGGGRYTSKKP